MGNRIQRDAAGEIDEIVTDGGAHLERMSDRGWFLNLHRADGSSVAVWLDGVVTLTEDRPAVASDHK